MSRNRTAPAQDLFEYTSVLSIAFDNHVVCLTSISKTPIQAVATLTNRLVGVCATAAFVRPHERAHPGPTRNVFSASLRFGRDRAAWPDRVCIKYVMGKAAVERLQTEANFYQFELRGLGGIAVPLFYGFFTGNIEQTPVACMVLELCEGGPVLMDSAEFSRLIMLAICKIHSVGVLHGGLSDYRHFVMRGKKVFLVDFSRAVNHSCRNALPQVAYDPRMEKMAPVGCSELYVTERNFGDAGM